MFGKNSKGGRKARQPADIGSLSQLGVSVEDCLRSIAQEWFGRGNFENRKARFVRQTISNTPEVLRSFANSLNIDLEYSHTSIGSLSQEKFPCILLIEDGLGVIASSRNGSQVELFVDGTVVVMDIEAVQSKIGSTIICPRPADQAEAPEVENSDIQSPGSVTPENPNPLIRLFRDMFAKHRLTMLQMMLAAMISNLMMIALPLFIMTVYDRVIPHSAMETLWALSIGVFIAFGLDLGMRHVRLKLTDAMAISTSIEYQSKLFRVFTNAPLEAVPRKSSIWTHTFRDIETATAIIPALTAAILIDFPFIVLVLFLVYSIANATVLAPIIGIALFGVWTVLAHIRMKKLGIVDGAKQDQKTEMLIETSGLMRTLKITNTQSNRISAFERLLDGGVQSIHSMRLTSGMQSQATAIVVQAAIVLAIIIGVYQINAGDMTVGALAATTLLVGRVLLPAANLLIVSARASQISNSVSRYYDFLNTPQETLTQKAEQRSFENGQLELKNVSYSFDGSATPSIKNISLAISKGEKVAIIGKSGCGKSTLLHLIARLYEPTDGNFLIDNFDSRQYAHSEIRQNVAFMPQETELVDTSIYNNVKLADNNAPDEKVARALMISGVNELIRSNPAGLGYEVGLLGERLSGGERQSIGLARTLISSADIVIMDEPTSSMDNNTEAKVIEGLKSALDDQTLIVATHRASVLSLVDRVIWMEGGAIVADESRDKVLGMMQRAG
ncbi:MAG: ATP-binding cassette domain-containing protein [Pseudomonadota bacterium]